MASLDSWAVNFDCSVCRRKRLIAAEFSKGMITKHRADPACALKCLNCVTAEASKIKGDAQGAASKHDPSLIAEAATGSVRQLIRVCTLHFCVPTNLSSVALGLFVL